jgi:hypothetical protein
MKLADYSSCSAQAVDCAQIDSVQDPLTQDLFIADNANHNIRKYTRSTGMETANPWVFLNGAIVDLLKMFIVVNYVLPRCVEHRGRQLQPGRHRRFFLKLIS